MKIRETTYQRLKRENEKLRQNLYEVVLNPNSQKAIFIINSIKLARNIEHSVWVGDMQSTGSGIIKNVE